MRRIYVAGLGAVSPAGWGVAALRSALESNQPLPAAPVTRPGWNEPHRIREVPPPSPRPAFLAHPRLRRASAITHYAVGAVTEALAMNGVSKGPPERLGLITCALSGCVQYTQRFFAEVLQNPATASPLLFPETVFNAPASHLATLLGERPVTCTLLGDPATFLQGLGLAADWLLEERVEACLVVGAEETNWLLADVVALFDRHVLAAGGAGALLLSASPDRSIGVELSQITDPQLYTTGCGRGQAARRMREALPAGAADELLCDGQQGFARLDRPEAAAWSDWPGTRLSPKMILGEGLMAAGAWQCVAAVDALQLGRFPAATVSVVGPNQHSLGARFCRAAG
jgi:3-oxoacyl-(acyl-carrier-protein) synthase